MKSWVMPPGGPTGLRRSRPLTETGVSINTGRPGAGAWTTTNSFGMGNFPKQQPFWERMSKNSLVRPATVVSGKRYPVNRTS